MTKLIYSGQRNGGERERLDREDARKNTHTAVFGIGGRGRKKDDDGGALLLEKTERVGYGSRDWGRLGVVTRSEKRRSNQCNA